MKHETHWTMNNQGYLKQFCIFRCRAGSHAYGTNIPSSDIDERGVFIAPPSYILSCVQSVEQLEDSKNDVVIFELRKFMKLAAQCNPNIIELLFTDEDNILEIHDAWRTVREHRHLFLSKKVKHTFSGYAISQLKRIKGHKKWITNPQPEQSPHISDYCKLVRADGTVTNDAEEIRAISSTCFIVETFGRTQFRIFSSPDFFAEKVGFFTDNGLQVKPVNIHDDVLKERRAVYVGFLIVNLDEFKKNHTLWKDYWTWKRNRNEVRAKMEEQHGFDCYSADTEFLTENGWKLFDDITNELKLATVNPKTHQIEYQNYIERYDARYTGPIYYFVAHHTDIRVTGNHRIYMLEHSRNLGKSYENWSFREACKLPDSFKIINRIKPRPRQFRNEKPCGMTMQHYLRLMGWYVSEGSVAHRLKCGTPSVLSLSQLKGSRLCWHISRAIPMFEKMGVTIRSYSHFRKSENRTEMTWTIAHRELAKRIVKECGHRCKDKKLPRWVMELSSRMQRILLFSLYLGDGTLRPYNGASEKEKYRGRNIYYTSSPRLANDVHELAFLAGYETSLWGPFHHGMYQVHINPSADSHRLLTRLHNVKSELVEDERIVCFSVPNEILVTRRNGRIAVHGNSKHALHLVRLMRMAKEILTEGKVIVRRPDAKELLKIRNGEFSYDWLIKWAEDMDNSLDELYNSSPLPHSADYVAIDELYRQVVLDFWTSHNLISIPS